MQAAVQILDAVSDANTVMLTACDPAGGGGSGVPPSADELIITEVMFNPSAVADGYGEWFEVYNRSSQPLELKGLTVQAGINTGGQFTILTSVVVPAGGYAVFAPSGDEAVNGGLTANYVYPYSQFRLSQADGYIRIRRDSDGVVFVDFGYPTNQPAGTASSLSAYWFGTMGSSEWKSHSHWCAATTQYGSGDYGTPLMTNPACE
jgi:hypothetical protein